MAHHKSALKRIRQSRKRRLYNRSKKRTIKYAIRDVREATSYDDAMEKFRKATRILDRAQAKGILPKNNVARKKSKLSARVKSLKEA